MRLLLLVLALAGARLSAQAWPAPLTEGLRVDLDVTRGVTLDAQGRVAKWTNQAGPAEVREFVGQDKGRKVPGSGLPAMGEGALVFRAQELLCHDEKAFDGLIKGDGCTWVAVLKPYAQAKGGLKDVNSFFGNLRNAGDEPEDFERRGPQTPDRARFRQSDRYGALWIFGLRGNF